MTPPKETFVRDLRRDRRLAGCADAIADLFKAIDHESYEVEDAATCLRALESITLLDLTTDQKLHHIARLLALDKVENLNVEEFIRLQ